MEKKNDKSLMEAKKWDKANPAMEPIQVPYGCESTYRYQQPVIHEDFENLPKDSMFLSFGEWGIVTVQSDYVMTPQEKGERQKAFQKEGAVIVGNMRLTSQTFSRDKNATLIDELGDMFEE